MRPLCGCAVEVRVGLDEWPSSIVLAPNATTAMTPIRARILIGGLMVMFTASSSRRPAASAHRATAGDEGRPDGDGGAWAVLHGCPTSDGRGQAEGGRRGHVAVPTVRIEDVRRARNDRDRVVVLRVEESELDVVVADVSRADARV